MKKEIPGYLRTFASKNIFGAAAAGDNEKVKQFLHQGVPINAQESDGNTALHAAVRYGHLHTVLFLLEEGAAINAVNNYNTTPYDILTQPGNFISMHDCGYTNDDIEILKQGLIEKGADTDSEGRLTYYNRNSKEFPETPW